MPRFTVLNKVIRNVLSSSSTHAPLLHQAQLMKSAQWLWCNLTDRWIRCKHLWASALAVKQNNLEGPIQWNSTFVCSWDIWVNPDSCLFFSHRYFTPPIRKTRSHWQVKSRRHLELKLRLPLTSAPHIPKPLLTDSATPQLPVPPIQRPT